MRPEEVAMAQHASSAAADAARAARAGRVWALVAALWAAYLVLDLLAGPEALRILMKGLLMPSLLLWVLVALGPAAPRLLVAGLVLATVGDVGLEFDSTFLVGMAGFLAMQVCYVLGFIGLGAWPAVRRNWPIAAGYLAFWVVVNLVLGPRLGDLRIPILVYSLALCVMAVCAAGVDRRVGTGGLLFLVSDMIIGLDLADLDFAGRASVVMVTYLAAQYLIATGWARRVRSDVVVPV
jgi:uncharacterized membrane protein YhhN